MRLGKRLEDVDNELFGYKKEWRSKKKERDGLLSIPEVAQLLASKAEARSGGTMKVSDECSLLYMLCLQCRLVTLFYNNIFFLSLFV